MAQLMYKIANEPPTDILSVNPKVPHGLVAFLDRALAKNPDERYQSGDEFAAALRAAAGAGAAAPAGGSRGVDIEL
jgi:serine/threonine-protein kinase